VDISGLGSCLVADIYVSNVESPGFTTRMLIWYNFYNEYDIYIMWDLISPRIIKILKIGWIDYIRIKPPITTTFLLSLPYLLLHVFARNVHHPVITNMKIFRRINCKSRFYKFTLQMDDNTKTFN